jgi:hypothetical protein
VSVVVSHGERIDQLTFNTNQRSIGPCGGDGGGADVAQGPAGTRLSYISGRAGEKIDQLTFYFVNR